jgi:hypothetical protein
VEKTTYSASARCSASVLLWRDIDLWEIVRFSGRLNIATISIDMYCDLDDKFVE